MADDWTGDGDLRASADIGVAVAYWRADSILVLDVKAVEITVESARSAMVEVRKLVGGASVPVLVDIRDALALGRGPRETLATEADFELALAFLVSSAFTRMIANIFLRLNRPDRPAKLFTSKDEALDWLRSFI